MKPDETKRFALLGLFGCNNYGNDGSLEAVLGVLRNAWPDAHIACVCVDPAKIERDHHIAGILINWPGFANPVLEFLDEHTRKIPRRLMNVVRTIKEVRQYDAIIVPGTGILCDYRADPFGAVYWIFRWCVAARLCGVKVCFVNVGAGPIERPLSRWMLKQAARAASYRSFRDSFSKDFVAGLGVDTSGDHVYPDIAFRLPFPRTPPRALPAGQPATVGVGVMWYDGWQGQRHPDNTIYETYLSEVGRFVLWLLGRGHPVRLLVGESTDEAVVNDLKDRLGKTGGQAIAGANLVAEPIHSLRDLMREIAQTDIVVASRYHNVVCALKLGRPTISVGYSVKHDQLMEQVGLGRFCLHIERFDFNGIAEQFLEIADNRTMFENLIADRVLEFQHRLEQQERILLQQIVPVESHPVVNLGVEKKLV